MKKTDESSSFKKAINSMVYVFLADGFEETEALQTIDILRRCGLKVQTLSVTGRRVVEGAHGIVVKADSLFRRNHTREAEAFVIPGGMQGAQTLKSNGLLLLSIKHYCARGTYIAAICAGPMVLGSAGVLKGRHMTCYPSLENQMGENIHYHPECFVVRHDNIITGSGPAATTCFAFTLAEVLVGGNIVEQVKKEMLFPSVDVPQNRAVCYKGASDVPCNLNGVNGMLLKEEQTERNEENSIFRGADADGLIF